MNPPQPDAHNAGRSPGLARERTELAWRRTALSLGAGLIGGLRLALRSSNPWTNPLTWIAVTTAAVYAGFLWRYSRGRNTEDRSVAVVGLTALLTLLAGLGALVFVVGRL